MTASGVLESPAAGIDQVVLDAAAISRRVRELGAEISRDCAGEELSVVGILKGAEPFVCDLVRAMPCPVRLDFISVSSYSPPPRGGGVRILKDLEEDVSGRRVLVVEDIVDTGLTLNYLLGLIRSRGPASLEVCTLLERPELRLVEIPVRYSGFRVSQEFLVGYGLDYREQFRNLPFIATLSREAAAD